MDNLGSWLTGWEQDDVIRRLLDYGLIKWDNERRLPLKSGGTTDIYMNLRDERSHPSAGRWLASVYRNPFLRLHPDRIVEIPDSVSGIAAHLSDLTGIPRITIRGEAKGGRVSNAKLIGDYCYGDHYASLDDVITDGASKVLPYTECQRLGLRAMPMIVLVDRQQGWQETFKNAGITTPVWPGMTLHTVRRYLIEHGIMERCSADAEENNRLIIAYDGRDWDEILPIADVLRPTGSILKVNDYVFEHGAKSIPDLNVYGRVMVDFKFYDIPNTVVNACNRLRKYNPWAVTVHASGQKVMIDGAVKAFSGTNTKVLAVTLLTSMDPESGYEVYRRQPWGTVKALAKIADRGGAHGFVCSPKEVKKLRKLYPKAILVTPGVRSPGEDVGDQKRVGTPQQALKDGADYLVTGRQVLGAQDPVAEVHRLNREEIFPITQK